VRRFRINKRKPVLSSVAMKFSNKHHCLLSRHIEGAQIIRQIQQCYSGHSHFHPAGVIDYIARALACVGVILEVVCNFGVLFQLNQETSYKVRSFTSLADIGNERSQSRTFAADGRDFPLYRCYHFLFCENE